MGSGLAWTPSFYVMIGGCVSNDYIPFCLTAILYYKESLKLFAFSLIVDQSVGLTLLVIVATLVYALLFMLFHESPWNKR